MGIAHWSKWAGNFHMLLWAGFGRLGYSLISLDFSVSRLIYFSWKPDALFLTFKHKERIHVLVLICWDTEIWQKACVQRCQDYWLPWAVEGEGEEHAKNAFEKQINFLHTFLWGILTCSYYWTNKWEGSFCSEGKILSIFTDNQSVSVKLIGHCQDFLPCIGLLVCFNFFNETQRDYLKEDGKEFGSEWNFWNKYSKVSCIAKIQFVVHISGKILFVPYFCFKV